MAFAPEFDERQFSELTKGIEIPAQPLTLIEVDREAAKGEPSLHKMAEVISKDLGVSAGVLRAVNSPLFGMRKKVSSIDHAVQMLGTRNVKGIVASIALRESLSKRSSPAMDRFMDSASDCALVCSHLAKELRIMVPEEAYTLGLFHDIGIPMMIMRFPNYKDVLIEANRDATFSITEVEDRHLGTNHAVVGYLIAHSWKLPQPICEAIFNHHRAEELLRGLGVTQDGAETKGLCATVSMLMMAEHISYSYRKRTDFHEWQRAGAAILDFFAILPEEFETMKEEIWGVLREERAE